MAGTVTKLGESRLESLLESAKLLNATLQVDDLLKHLLRTVMGRLLVSRGVIAIKKGTENRVALGRGCPGLPVGALFDPETAKKAGLDLFFDIGDPDAPIGILGISNPARGELEMEEQDFVRALLGLAASGIANAQAHDEAVRSNRSLDQKVQELRALLDLVKGLASTLDPEEIAQLLVLTLSGRWIVRKHAITTWREGHPEIVRHKGLDLPPSSVLRAIVEPLPDSTVLEAGELADKLCAPEGSLILPVRSGEVTVGVVVCGPRMNKVAYNEADREFGAGLVAQAAVALENAWHFRETLGKKQLEKELSLAAAIQKGLFPEKLPDMHRSDIAARNLQAKQVGGDYYDAIPIDHPGPSSPHLLCVVDISGKGMFASILMSNIQATLRALLSRESDLPLLAVRANDLLHATTPSNRYATAILVVYDPETGGCAWVNAGHNDGVVLPTEGEVRMLECSGLALGLFAKRKYESQAFTLQGGDILALYSDGVTEAQDLEENEFGIGRLIDCLRANRHRPAKEMVDAVFEEIAVFVGEAPQFDDITLMILKRSKADDMA
jgi:sigma-B regulation protein RsbU (phosphoserine phosphatase)